MPIARATLRASTQPPRRECGLPASREKTLATLDEKIRDIKLQTKLVRNGVHPNLVTEGKTQNKKRGGGAHVHPKKVVKEKKKS